MFTGITKGIGRIEKISKEDKLKKVSIKAPISWKFFGGESVSVSGVCSTVISSKKNIFDVEYMPETLSKTTADIFKAGDEVNLEKSLKVGDSLDGHFVYGHIDATGKILEVRKEGESVVLSIFLPKDIAKYVVNKGSVAIDGISLTISKKMKDRFEVSLIPHTIKNTTLKKLVKNDLVNIETDILSKIILSNKK